MESPKNKKYAYSVCIILVLSFYSSTQYSPIFAQNATSARMGNAITNSTLTESEDPGGEPLPQIIVTLNERSSGTTEAESFSDSVETLTAKIENQGIPATINDTFPVFNQFAINVEDVPSSNFSKVLPGYSIDLMNDTQRQESVIDQAINILEQDPNVKSASQNFKQVAHQLNINSPQVIPKGIDRTDADLSIPPGKSGDNKDAVDADIAILDCGVDPNDDLNIRLDTEVSAVIGSTPRDGSGHGTHVAGIAAAKDNGIGVVGTAPGARIWNVKVLDYDSSAGTCTTDTLTIIRGLQYVARHADEIEVTNLSLGATCNITISRCLNPDYENAINDLVSKGVVVVVSAGNNGIDAANVVPARFQNVITVSNIADSDGKCGGQGQPTHRGPDDTLATNSNYGSVVDVAAPGVNILSTSINNKTAHLSGTSMSAPHVAGEAALFMSLNPLAPPSVVRNAIVDQGSNLGTQCDNNGKGYFTGDKDPYSEPMSNLQDISTITPIH
jgi:subtilisin family serine protease